MRSKPCSLRWGLIAAMLACCILPAIIIAGLAGMLLKNYYGDFFQRTANASAVYAMRQVELLMTAAVEDSKSVSYEGEVRRAYRAYQQDGDEGVLYRTLSDYLSQKFSRNQSFKAVFITFLDGDETANPYMIRSDTNSYSTLQKYRSRVEPKAVRCAQGADTRIYFLEDGGELYMVRNILDSSFEPYATLTMLCDQENLFQALAAVTGVADASLALDGIALNPVLESGPLTSGEFTPDGDSISAETEIEGHALTFAARLESPGIWGALPMLRWLIFAVVILITVPVLAAVYLFYRHVSHPVGALVQAAARVQAGERGYQVEEPPPNRELMELCDHFNSMSAELKRQFDHLNLEQQALHQARIKALQSQINPHFLNNTLEVIGWEARMAENDRICAMTDALSLLMEAAVGRDDRAQIPLREELGYIDAYLYIIQTRLGDRLSVAREIDTDLLDIPIPRLSIQPLVENAVEHDISARPRSELCLRAYREAGQMHIEVEHDGFIAKADWERIRELLNAPLADAQQPPRTVGSVGIRNVSQRLRLFYGDKARLDIWESKRGKILARLSIPIGPPAACAKAAETADERFKERSLQS